MANTETTTSRKQGGSSWISIAVAVVTVGLFLGWLATREPAETVAVEEPDAAADTADELAAGPATVIRPEALVGGGAQEYIGQTVELESVEVMSPMGTRLFWVELPGGTPYLVQLEQGEAPPSGQRVRVTGVVRAKDDGVLDDWEQRGILESEGHRLQAEYGTTYIQARRAQPAGRS